jgi:putative phage-type endonuclease
MKMEQRSEEWFEARRGRVTASLVGGLLGLSPHMKEQEAFRALGRSVHGLPSEFEGNIATEYGTANEPLACAAYEMETGNTVEHVGFAPLGDWAGASPDGLIGEYGLLEIKCPFGKRKDENPEFASADDQLHYYAQMQFQMICTGRLWCDFYQWSPHGSRLERVEFDTEWKWKNLLILMRKWQDAQDSDKAEFEAPLRRVIDTPEAARLVAEYDELRDAIDNAKDRQKDILERMVEMSGKRNASIAGRNLTLTKRAGAISYGKAVKELLPDADLEPYRGKPSQSWGLK